MRVASKNLLIAFCMFFACATTLAQNKAREYYELRFYQYTGDSSENRLDQYFKNALVPALHKAGIKRVGVFKSSQHDTSTVRRFLVLIPYSSLSNLDNLYALAEKDAAYQTAGRDFLAAEYNNAPYQRMEKIVLKAFTGAPVAQKPALTGDLKDRVYELRSYEGPTEQLYRTKVKMFNTGDEVGLFKRLGFNAVFYAEVLAGKAMPNLMYMTSFNNMQSREEHWKAFGSDPQWEKLKSDKQYDNTVSHIDTWFFSPAEYSDF